MGRPTTAAGTRPVLGRSSADGMLDREPPDHTRLRRLVSKAFTPRTGRGAPAADRGDRRRACSTRAVEARRVRPDRRRRRAAAGHGHRGAAGRPRGRPPPAPALVGRHLPDVRAEPAARVAQQPGGRRVEAFGPTCGTCARPSCRSAGRPHQRAGAGGRCGRPPHRGRADRHLRRCCSTPVTRPRSTGPATAGGRCSAIPARWRSSAADPTRCSTAVEELLRCDTPLPMFERWVLEDIEVRRCPDRRVATSWRSSSASANRDPDASTDPEALRPRPRIRTRTSPSARDPLLPRAPLALELGILFGALLEALPDLRAARGAGLEAHVHPPGPRRARGADPDRPMTTQETRR